MANSDASKTWEPGSYGRVLTINDDIMGWFEGTHIFRNHQTVTQKDGEIIETMCRGKVRVMVVGHLLSSCPFDSWLAASPLRDGYRSPGYMVNPMLVPQTMS